MASRKIESCEAAVKEIRALSAVTAPRIARPTKVKGERVNENALALPLKPKSSVASADVIQLGGVVADHLVLLAFIDRVDPLRYELFGARPRRVGVRVVRRPHQPVRAVLLAGEADILGLELEYSCSFPYSPLHRRFGFLSDPCFAFCQPRGGTWRCRTVGGAMEHTQRSLP